MHQPTITRPMYSSYLSLEDQNRLKVREYSTIMLKNSNSNTEAVLKLNDLFDQPENRGLKSNQEV